MTLSSDERRALAVLAALILLAMGARWIDRPKPILADVEDVDLVRLEDESRARRPPDRSRDRPAGPIDPNTASAEDLTRLPGVGPSLAARIIEERERRPFASLDDLQRVRGIGPALATGWADLVTLPRAPQPYRGPTETTPTPEETGSSNARSTALDAPRDLNEISSADLQRVPGIGPVLAERLIARRDSLGRFARWEQVDSVAGIGPALLSRMRELLFITR